MSFEQPSQYGTITIRRPDDWHVHLRDEDMLRAVAPLTARQFGRAMVMPNLKNPITTVADAKAYRERILNAVPNHMNFTPLMTVYLTDQTDADDLAQGFRSGVFVAAKLYPAGATTNSDRGVTDMENISNVLACMEDLGMPLLVHGEVANPDVDVFDREHVFIEQVLMPTMARFQGLKVVFEHITTSAAVDFVRSQGPRMGATITVHHLQINRSDLFQGGIHPHLYCLPIAKREHHRLALIEAATSGESQFFLGTDTAPHDVNAKESDCGCAGIFSAPAALELYAQVFDEQQALDKFEAFSSLNGARFYGLEPHDETVTLVKEDWVPSGVVAVDKTHFIKVYKGNGPLRWHLQG